MSQTQNQSHATRFYDGQALQERHPDLTEPFHGDVVKDEIAIAFGRRHVHKLVELKFMLSWLVMEQLLMAMIWLLPQEKVQFVVWKWQKVL